jgi:hypothetical protein
MTPRSFLSVFAILVCINFGAVQVAAAESQRPPQVSANREGDENEIDRSPAVSQDDLTAAKMQAYARQNERENDRDFWLGAAVAFFAAMQAVFAAIAILTSRAQLRAYVLLDKARIELGNASGGRRTFTIKMRLKNSGQTPAFALTLASNGRLGPPDDHLPVFDAMRPASERGSTTILGPGAEIEFPPFAIQISDGDLLAVGQNRKRVYAWVLVDYRDAFSRPRQTQVFVRSEGQHEMDWPVAPCKEGNHAT